jgi:C-terminal processing protease CtpA/Prc
MLILFNKEKLFKIFKVIMVILGLFCYFMTFYKTIMIENVHNLTYDSYTNSFKKSLKILEKEYVLNDYKKINYNYLYDKYYPSIEDAELNNDEYLYYKTMFEFAREFKDGHFIFELYYNNYYTNLDDLIEKYQFLNDYNNRNYGFASILLSNNEVVAILVDKDSDAYRLGLRDGMTITKKDNQDINELIDDIITPLDGYPVYDDERLMNSFYLFATGEESITVSFIDETGEEKTIEVTPIDYEDKPDMLLEKFFYYDDTLNNLDTKMLNNDTGYIYIKSEMYAPFRGAISYLTNDASYLTKIIDEKLEQLKSSGMKKLIIDLRANSGGYETESIAIASLFTTDNYIVSKTSKGKSKLYDYTSLKGNGKYSDIKTIVLVNSYTASAGDLLAYMLSKCKNTTLIGITNSNNSAQSVGGMIYLSGGTAYISYPIYTSYNNDETIQIDTNDERIANIKVDERIELNKNNIAEIVYSNNDYLLEYAINLMK